MRGRPRRLGIPFEHWTPGEGADLKTEDEASSSLRRPSPGSRRALSTSGTPGDSRYKQHGLERIISVTAAAHIAARRVMEKAGLIYEGTRYWMNPEVPVVSYALDRAVWQAKKSPDTL
jgi:hypothetical protein